MCHKNDITLKVLAVIDPGLLSLFIPWITLHILCLHAASGSLIIRHKCCLRDPSICVTVQHESCLILSRVYIISPSLVLLLLLPFLLSPSLSLTSVSLSLSHEHNEQKNTLLHTLTHTYTLQWPFHYIFSDMWWTEGQGKTKNCF